MTDKQPDEETPQEPYQRENVTGIFAKIAVITRELGAIKKSGHNDYFKYNYHDAYTIFAHAGRLMGEYHVACIPSFVSFEQVGETVSDRPEPLYKAVFDITFVDGDTGEDFVISWVSFASDKADKAANKAVSNAMKYALMRVFQISDVDPEADLESPVNDQRRAAPPRTGRQRPTAPQNPAPPTPPQKIEYNEERIITIVTPMHRNAAHARQTVKKLIDEGTIKPAYDNLGASIMVMLYRVKSDFGLSPDDVKIQMNIDGKLSEFITSQEALYTVWNKIGETNQPAQPKSPPRTRKPKRGEPTDSDQPEE